MGFSFWLITWRSVVVYSSDRDLCCTILFSPPSIRSLSCNTSGWRATFSPLHFSASMIVRLLALSRSRCIAVWFIRVCWARLYGIAPAASTSEYSTSLSISNGYATTPQSSAGNQTTLSAMSWRSPIVAMVAWLHTSASYWVYVLGCAIFLHHNCKSRKLNSAGACSSILISVVQ